MKGWEALKALEEGKGAYRKSSNRGKYWVYIIKNGRLCEKCICSCPEYHKGFTTDPNRYSSSLQLSDLLAEDWEIYEEEPTLKPCPFCGSSVMDCYLTYADHDDFNYSFHEITCDTLGCALIFKIRRRVSDRNAYDELIKRWNQRHGDK